MILTRFAGAAIERAENIGGNVPATTCLAVRNRGFAVTAESIAIALHGRKVGSSWMVPCPAHEDSNPSLESPNATASYLCGAMPAALRRAWSKRSRGAACGPNGNIVILARNQHLLLYG